MHDYFIYFFGLICHVGIDERKDFAALVRDHDHLPSVRFETGNWIDVSDAARIAFRIGGTVEPGIQAIEDARFSKFVPSLKNLMGGQIQGKVEDFAILVDYPPTFDEGEDRRKPSLSVADVYEELATHAQGGNVLRGPACVARLTVVAIRTPHDTLGVVKFVGKDPDPKDVGTVPSGCCVIIGNVSKPHRHTTNHARKYGHLLNAENDAINVVKNPNACKDGVENVHCDWVKKLLATLIRPRSDRDIDLALGMRTANDVECGNTDWP